jgi:hypothetical protein
MLASEAASATFALVFFFFLGCGDQERFLPVHLRPTNLATGLARLVGRAHAIHDPSPPVAHFQQ